MRQWQVAQIAPKWLCQNVKVHVQYLTSNLHMWLHHIRNTWGQQVSQFLLLNFLVISIGFNCRFWVSGTESCLKEFSRLHLPFIHALYFLCFYTILHILSWFLLCLCLCAHVANELAHYCLHWNTWKWMHPVDLLMWNLYLICGRLFLDFLQGSIYIYDCPSQTGCKVDVDFLNKCDPLQQVVPKDPCYMLLVWCKYHLDI